MGRIQRWRRRCGWGCGSEATSGLLVAGGEGGFLVVLDELLAEGGHLLLHLLAGLGQGSELRTGFGGGEEEGVLLHGDLAVVGGGVAVKRADILEPPGFESAGAGFDLRTPGVGGGP